MTISAATRRVQYSGSAGVGPYSFSFEVLAQTDLDVYLNTTLLTLTTDYTVSLNGSGSGTITLVVAATGSDTVTIHSARPIARSADYVTGGDLLADTLNDEQDAEIIFLQQLEENYDRLLNVAPYDTATSMTLPDAADRASKYLAFDADGNPTATSGTTSNPIISTFAETLLDDTSASVMRTTLGVAIGADVQAYDADLAAIAGLTSAANKVPMFSGSGTATLLDFKDEDNMASDSATAVPSQQSVKAYVGATKISGDTVQVVEATPYTSLLLLDVVIPLDDTIPQNTEGKEVITVSITPTNASNRLRIEFDGGHLAAAGSVYIISALFRDSTANALAASMLGLDAGSPAATLRLSHEMAAGTTSATTFKIRVGPHSGSVYLNGQSGSRQLGGVAAARLRVTEIKA